jgi:hypothetical protein
LNNLFLLEGRSTSSMTISYSILFCSAWLGFAGEGEGNTRCCACANGKTKGARRVAKSGTWRKNKGRRSANGGKTKGACRVGVLSVEGQRIGVFAKYARVHKVGHAAGKQKAACRKQKAAPYRLRLTS